MRGYVAVTDPGWYRHLSREPGPKDANFWRPSAKPRREEVGAPFFFKLKAPHHAIAGFGFFAGFTVLPDWLAWDTFGEANGVASLAELRARLSRIQRGARIAGEQGGLIGCCLIAEARFFPEGDWVDAPADWSMRTQSGARVDLGRGEGERIWRECLARSAAEPLGATVERSRYGAPALHAPRLGQGIFRVQVLDAYGRACAVTGEHSLPVLEAAHIRPYAEGGEHDVRNGMALRTDVHRLFDRGYVTFDEDMRFVVGRRLKEEFSNGRSYYGLHGSAAAFPQDPRLTPANDAMRWHRENVFVG